MLSLHEDVEVIQLYMHADSKYYLDKPNDGKPLKTMYFNNYDDDINRKNNVVFLVNEDVMGEDNENANLGCEVDDDVIIDI